MDEMDHEINNTHHTHTHTNTLRGFGLKDEWVKGWGKKEKNDINTTQETQICTYAKAPIHTLRHLCVETHLS